MSMVRLDNSTCHYRLDGVDEQPVLMLIHPLGLDLGMWDEQVAALSSHARVLRYDLRGHGASSVPEGEYAVPALGADALALADALGIRQFACCGQSLGGMVGLWLAAHAPDRVTHLVVANTSARTADPGPMETRRRAVLDGGMGPVTEAVLGRFFTPGFLARRSAAVQWAQRTLLATDPLGYAGCCAAIRDLNLTMSLAAIRAPTLVMTGDHDLATPWVGHGDVLAAAIKGARVARLPAAHVTALELPRSFTAAVAGFIVPASADRLDVGLAMRRSVMGHAYVGRAIAETTDLTRAFQELVTTSAWGAVWTRPGLDRRTRRLLVLSMTATQGRWEEFRLHLSAGLDDGLEWCDVEEALLQVAAYAGLPAANTAFHIAAGEQSKRHPSPAPE